MTTFVRIRQRISVGASACHATFLSACGSSVRIYPNWRSSSTRHELSSQKQSRRDGMSWASPSTWKKLTEFFKWLRKAHRAGVKQLWAGNYGALTPSVQPNFDEGFTGYSEQAVAQHLGKTLDHLQHPPLIVRFRLPGGWALPVGILFTARGCSFQCSFCQTIVFAPQPKPIPLDALERVIRFYVTHGTRHILILDENFGNLPAHAEAVIDLLARYGIHWVVQSRVDLFLRNFDDWLARGMEGALFGIESFNQNVLKQIRKGQKAEAVWELTKRLHREGLYAQGYYIIGFPSETAGSVREDLRTLASLELDVTQITIVTPHPRTQLWSELESNYGIFEKTGPNMTPSTWSGAIPPAVRENWSRYWRKVFGSPTVLVGCLAFGENLFPDSGPGGIYPPCSWAHCEHGGVYPSDFPISVRHKPPHDVFWRAPARSR